MEEITVIEKLKKVWSVSAVSALSDGPIFEFRRIGWDVMKQPGVAITVYKAGTEEKAWKMLADTFNVMK
jgi:hypothetical protein